MLGLYLHIPFCSSICSYCNFNRGLYDEALKTRYVEALLAEIRRAPADLAADTIFFGGGTPSLLAPEEVGDLIAACRARFAIPDAAEVTLETNPESVDVRKLAAFRDAGVNRVSFGVQSFRDDELTRLSRRHTAGRAGSIVRDARAAGFDNVSLDLMMWLPGQRVSDWLGNVEALIAADPDHASLYMLELYPNAPLRDDMARAGWSLAPDEDAAEMYLAGLRRLDEAGYRQYEISNVARPGRESRHNLKYWMDGEWLGFGCGAHSTREHVRWKNVASTTEYIARVGDGADLVVERRALTREEQVEEALFTGLRLNDGVDIGRVGKTYGCDVWDQYGDELQPFVDAGLLRRDGTSLRLTREGMLVANEIMRVFV